MKKGCSGQMEFPFICNNKTRCASNRKNEENKENFMNHRFKPASRLTIIFILAVVISGSILTYFSINNISNLKELTEKKIFEEQRELSARFTDAIQIKIENVTAGFRNEINPPVWSPDGKMIAFNDKEGEVIKVMSLIDGSIEDIKTGLLNVDIYHLDWSPDGKRFVFGGWKGGDPEFWFVENFLPIEKFSQNK